MRSFFVVASLLALSACGQASAPSTPTTEIERRLGPDGIIIGEDVRALDPSLFQDPWSRALFNGNIVAHCRDVQTVEECNAILSDVFDGDKDISGARLSATLSLNGIRTPAHIFFNDTFKIDTIDISFSALNQASYESMLLALHQRYGVNEASESEYNAYNSNSRACLVNRNDDATVLLVAQKDPIAGWNTGGTSEVVHVIYRKRWFQARAASGLT